MLEVAIGLVFVYLVLSLLCSAIAEALEHYLRYRADYLRQGIQKLLFDGDTTLLSNLYEHPLIKSLYTRSKLERLGRAKGPSYIPSRRFVLALLDLVNARTAPANGTPSQNPVAELRAALEADQTLPRPLVQALRTLIDDAGDDLEKVKVNVQEWFDDSMERVAGWYKRRAQFVLLTLGTAIAVVVNVDTLAIINTLSNDSVVRAAVISAAETHVRENRPAPARDAAAGAPTAPGQAPPPTAEQLTADVRAGVAAATRQLGALGLPVGWRLLDNRRGGLDEGLDTRPVEDQSRYRIENRIFPTAPGDWMDQLFTHLLGWLLTAFAVSFGAPFWFDLLNKIMVIRSTVKPREKSGEEGSEDRPQGSGSQTVRIEVASTKP
jgi:hypothetical protein